MELENKIKCVLMDFEINEITLQEATKRILLLLDVVGRSEQLTAFADYVQGRMWEGEDKDLSEFIEEFLSL